MTENGECNGIAEPEHGGCNGITEPEKHVFKLVLTGGPCGGKTTGQARLTSFFESLGWKVYRIPETATVLMSGGVKFADLSREEAYNFQANLLRTIIQIEKSLFDLASVHAKTQNVIYICDRGVMDPTAFYQFQTNLIRTLKEIESVFVSLAQASSHKNTLLIMDRGTMDASAFLDPADWEKMKIENNWHEVELRDTRYDLVVHMVSAAIGAEKFYTTHDHVVRSENLEEARERDRRAQKAWIGHPAYTIIDNTTNFEMKIQRLIRTVCEKLDLYIENWPAPDSKKRKFLIEKWPDNSEYPEYQQFKCIHDYLVSPDSRYQARIRRRGKDGFWTYTLTKRQAHVHGQRVELKRNITGREYQSLLQQKDPKNATIFMKRRCFLWENQYYKLDYYMQPCPRKCAGLFILSTHTNLLGDDLKLPPFLKQIKEITDLSEYSMYNLSKIDIKDNNMVNGRRSEMIDAEFLDSAFDNRDLPVEQ